MKRWWSILILYFFVLLCWAIWSYSQTDPNLTLINQPFFINFQTLMWSFGADRLRLSIIYTGIILLSFICYGVVYWRLKQIDMSLEESLKRWGWKKLVLAYFLLCLPLFISYNALSHDVFNYIFNARMVVKYGANPHVQVALDFASDTWTRFMHNTHTPAPYAYGWTALSLIPYVLGFGKFIITWLMFRLMAFVSLILLVYDWWRYGIVAHIKIKLHEVALVLINPLVLFEIIVNQHNDLWMMVPALMGIVFIATGQTQKWRVIAGWLLFIFSISIKYATVILIAGYFLLVMANYFDKVLEKRVPQLIAGWFVKQYRLTTVILKLLPLPLSILMFLPLLLPRSQQFHPWYLTWVLVWIPIMPLLNSQTNRLGFWQIMSKNKIVQVVLGFRQWWISCLVVLSLASMLRYVPWLLAGGFSGQILMQQKVMTWMAIPFSVIYWVLSRYFHKTQLKRID